MVVPTPVFVVFEVVGLGERHTAERAGGAFGLWVAGGILEVIFFPVDRFFFTESRPLDRAVFVFHDIVPLYVLLTVSAPFGVIHGLHLTGHRCPYRNRTGVASGAVVMAAAI